MKRGIACRVIATDARTRCPKWVSPYATDRHGSGSVIKEELSMPIILWLLGVPLSVVIILVLLNVV